MSPMRWSVGARLRERGPAGEDPGKHKVHRPKPWQTTAHLFPPEHASPADRHRALGLERPLSTCGPLLQRVAFTIIGRDGAYGSWIDAALRKGKIFLSVSVKQPRKTEVSFD